MQFQAASGGSRKAVEAIDAFGGDMACGDVFEAGVH